jgi:hypothetical protein
MTSKGNQTINQQSATIAANLLVPFGWIIPSKIQRTNLAVCFAEKNKILYGRAFDVVKFPSKCDLNNRADISQHLKKIKCAEVKSTNRAEMNSNFDKDFFGITNAEILVAQSLGEQFCFLFVNTKTNAVKEMSLHQLFAKAVKIYPTMSIHF